jgi:crotonobetainyl-CoA:carnitine CoA-transferase CaiB-like acyl-CoA transferase
MAGPLHGFRVLETGEGPACALAGMLMADFGADVIRLDGACPPDPGYVMWHRGKQPIGSLSSGQDGLDLLLADADVCVVGPGREDLRDRLDALAASHPRVVFLMMPPYHGAAPWPGESASSELIAAAMGLARRQSSVDGGPVHSVYPHVSYIHGAWAAACAVAALAERETSGRGQVVTVTGAHAALLTGLATFVIDPDAPAVTRPAGPGGPHPMYTTYECADGQWLFLGALTAKFQERAVEVLGLPDLKSDERLGGVLDRAVLPGNRDWVRSRLAGRFRCRPRGEWLDLLEKADCPAGPVLERDQWLDSPQLRAIGMRLAMPTPAGQEILGQEIVMPGIPLAFGKSPGRVRSRWCRDGGPDAAPASVPPHEYVVPSATVVPSAGTGLPVNSASSATGAPAGEQAVLGKGPLSGVRVLDLGTVLAGPLSGCLLSELGADVIKVEPLSGDPFRVRGFVYNRGMRSIALNLRDPAGKNAFNRLAARGDVVLDNFRPGVLRRLGVDYDSLRTVNPGIVCFSLTGFGDRGPLRDKPGFDPILQAMSGMMSAQGGDSGPVFLTVAVNDIAGGVMGALAACLGVLHRRRTGEGQRIDSSLAAMSAFMQSGELLRFHGRPPAQVGSADFRGPSPLRRYYQTRDGWARVDADGAEEPAAARAVANALGIAAANAADPATPVNFAGPVDTVSTEGPAGALLYPALSARAAASPTADFVAWMAGLGVPATAARRPDELPGDEALMAHEAFHEHRRADGRPFFAPGRLARFGRTQETRRLEPPGVGEHTRALLSEAGLPESEIDALIDAGAAAWGAPFAVTELVAYR